MSVDGVGRRRFLRAGLVAGGVAGLAGCLSAPTAEVRWSYRTRGAVFSSPAVVGPRVYVGSEDDNCYALTADGPKWIADTDGDVFGSPTVVPSAAGGHLVVVGSKDGRVYGFDADGIAAWSHETGGEVWGSATVATGDGLPDGSGSGVAYVGSEDETLYALSIDDGSAVWTAAVGNTVQSTPAVAHVPDDGAGPAAGRTVVVVGSYDGNCYAFDAATGEVVWRTPLNAQVLSSPAVDAPSPAGTTVHAPTVGGTAPTDGDPATVYVGSYDGNVYALSLASGDLRWRHSTGDSVGASPTVVGDAVYAGSFDYHVYAIDRSTGERRWRFDTGNGVFSSPAVVDGTVYVGSLSGRIHAIDATEGTRQWTYLTDEAVYSSPAVVEGTVYVGSTDGRLYALGPP